MDLIYIPMSPGELLDKITILEIKSERMDDAAKVANVRTELALLQKTWADAVTSDATVQRLHGELKAINEALDSKIDLALNLEGIAGVYRDLGQNTKAL